MKPNVCHKLAPNYPAEAIPGKLTGNENVPIVGNKVLENLLGAVHDIYIPPVHPRMLRLERRGQEVVAGLAHGLAPGSLGLEGMTLLDTLAQLESKVLLDNHGAPELVGALLETVELGRQDSEGIIGRVANEEAKIDQIVGVCKLGKKLEILGEVGGGILERSENENSFFVLDSLGGGLDGVQVDVVDGGLVDNQGRVVIKDYWRVMVGVPCCLFVL